MASGFEDLECVICNENLVDPRALPCGHSFCGLPRPCLTGLKSSTGGICCAICRVDHDLKPEDIKPLYGIRDYLLKKQTTPDIPCSVHTSKECTFWCTNCETMICVDCIEKEHDDHSVRNLRKHLIAKVESHFGKSWRDEILNYREVLETMMASGTFELEKLKLRIEEIKKQLQVVQLQTSVIDSYTKTLSQGSAEKRVSEKLSLLNLSNLELLEMDRVESSTQCSTACCETSTQYESCTRSVSSQSDSVLEKNQTASQTDAFMSLCSTSLTERDIPNANCSPCHNKADKNQQPTVVLCYDRGTSDSIVSSCANEETSDDEMIRCSCIIKHKKVSNWNFPICQRACLRISRGNPLEFRKSNTFFVCPFMFWVEAKLVQHKHKPKEKMFKIILICLKGSEKYDLPPSTFRYVFVLMNHNENGMKKKYEGTWHYPKHEQLYWHSITYSELNNPEGGWIIDDEVKVEIELMKVA